MKKIVLLIITVLFLTTSYSQNINGKISSSLYSFDRIESIDNSSTYIRGYQMMDLNINQDNFSLRTALNFENSYLNKLDSDQRIRFYNLYIEERKIFDIATIKLGRQPIYNDVIGGAFDGASIKLSYKTYNLSAFYGGNVPAYEDLRLVDNWSKNYVLGGEFSTTFLENFFFAAGYTMKNFKPEDYWALRLDEQLNPILILIRENSNQYQYINWKIDYNLERILNVFTRYEYDLNYAKISKVELECDYNKIDDLSLNLYFNYREPMINYNSIFSVFDYGNTKELEVGSTYKLNSNLSLSGRVGYVNYSDENSERITISASTKYSSISYRKTFGYEGELDAISAYTGYTFLDGLLTPSIGLSYSSYRITEGDSKNNITTILAGLNIRPIRILSFDLQGQYMNNPIYKNDFRFLLKINYWFNTNL